MNFHDTTYFVSSLKEILSNEVQIVIKPEHPYIIDGPDILIGINGSLTAIFLLHNNLFPEDYFSSMLARWIGTKIAYPRHIKTVLMKSFPTGNNSWTSIERSNGLEEYFDFVLTKDNFKQQIRSIILERGHYGNNRITVGESLDAKLLKRMSKITSLIQEHNDSFKENSADIIWDSSMNCVKIKK